MPHDDFLTRKQVADLYPIPYSTLKKLSMRNAKVCVVRTFETVGAFF
jgi:hypothetical protein